MGDALTAVLAEARRSVAKAKRADVAKTIWGSPAGKKRLAKRLVAMLPAHSTYVEPFAGSAAVLFEKEPCDVEVINDADPEIADAYRLIKKLGPKDLAKLGEFPWTGSERTFKALLDAAPKGDLERLHRFLYLTHFSYGKMRGKSYSPSTDGVEARTVSRIERCAPRLARVKVFGGDYEKVVRKFDSEDTVHFLDPPYVGYDVDVGESRFDEQRFFDLLQSIKGKFLVTYGVRGELPKLVERAGFWTKRIRTRRSIGSMHGVGGSTVLTQLLVANYEPVTKSLDDAFIVEPWTAPDNEPAPSAHRESAFEKSTQLVKGLDPSDERYVLGIVLEPEVVDAQGDIYSAEEIRGAAHRFMEEFGGLGLMHRLRVNGDVKVLESYLAPTDFAVGDLTVRKGTWMLAVRVLSDDLWARVQSGDLTGFSIGGSARRVPEPASASRVEESLGAATEAA